MRIRYRYGKTHSPKLNALISDATKTDEMIAAVTDELSLMPLLARIELLEAHYAGLKETEAIVINLRQNIHARFGDFILSQIENEEA